MLGCLVQVPEQTGPATSTLSRLVELPPQLQVLCVDPHTPTLLAYKQMLRAGVSGGAVKANGNSMIANLSISDLRPVCPPVEQRLHPEGCATCNHVGLLLLMTPAH